MLESKKHLDPIAYAFIKNDGLELAERTGLALLEAAREIKIEFDRNFLPRVNIANNLGAFFNFSEGIMYQFHRRDEFLEAYPDEAEFRDACEHWFRQFDRERSYERTPTMAALEDAAAGWGGSWGGHANPDFGRIVNIGTDGVREIIAKYRAEGKTDSEWFYKACSYALDALDVFGDRFRELALRLAAETEDEAERALYREAARAFEVIPRRPAYDFTSAVHAFWLTFTFDGIDSPGRFDQYMYPAYAMTEDKSAARAALERLWESFHDTRTWNLCLSGSDENWNDETNELTYDILALAAEKKYQTPNITLRVHRNTPARLWDAIADTLATGIGMPALYNDEVVCPAFETIGIPPCDSHDYCMNGCNQIDIMGKSHMGLEDGEVSFGKCLEYALHNGKNALSGAVDTLESGDVREFTSYEEVERAFMRQLDFVTHMSCNLANLAQQARAAYSPNPFRSCLIEGCLERGIDYRNGGPLYGHGQILGEAIADTGDSLWAIKKLVFDEKKYTMSELLDALDANFTGYDELWRDFSSCEKFGNDFEPVDEITSRIFSRFCTVLKRHRTYRGGVFTGGCSPFSRAPYYGLNIAALPNGKRQGEALIADSNAAVPGCDVNGPTAHIKSALKYDHANTGSGFIFQIKFDKKLFNTEKGKESFKGLAKTFFALGGQQFTANVVSAEELLDAQEHPERHRDLIVRVGGYSDYFVNLHRDLQDNVIARTVTEL